MSPEETAVAAAREALCRLLAACYYEPDPMFAEERLFESMADAARRIDPDLGARAQRLGDAFAAHDLQDLLVDYTRLFIGPGTPRARPYAASWSGEPASPASHAAVLDLYREGGFDVDADFRELPDHVAVELEFLYVLTFNANRDAQRAQDLRRRFLDGHLGRWLGAFAAATRSGAETSFYRELADLTERFVRMEGSAQATR